MLIDAYFPYLQFVIQLQNFDQYAKTNQNLFLPTWHNNYYPLGGGCQDTLNEDVTPNELKVSLKLVNGTLHFSSIEDYDNLFEAPESFQLPKFQSLSKSLIDLSKIDKKKLRLSQEEIDLLNDLEGSQIMDILDSDQMVVIEENLFYLDFYNRVIAVTSNHSLRQNLIQKEYNNSSIRLFSFEDDVLDLIIDGSESTVSNLVDLPKLKIKNSQISNRVMFTGENCDWNTCKVEDIEIGTSGVTDYRIRAEHKYISLGIFFELFSKADHSRTGGLGWVSQETQMIILWDFWFISRKNSPTFRQPNIGNFTGFTDSKKILYYRENRSLEAFRLDTNFSVDIGGDHGNGYFPNWNFDLFTISKQSWRE